MTISTKYVSRAAILMLLSLRSLRCSVSTSTENTVATQESVETFEEETPNKVKKVELEIQSDKEDSSTGTNSDVGTLLIYVTSWRVC